MFYTHYHAPGGHKHRLKKIYTYSLQLFQAMKQRIAYKMPFVRKCFLGCCSLGLSTLKRLFSFFSLIINQAYCMWFKDAHFISQKHQKSSKCMPITDKTFWFLPVKRCRSKQLTLSSNSFWNNPLLLQPSCFLYCHSVFCKPPVRAWKLFFQQFSTAWMFYPSHQSHHCSQVRLSP